MLLHTYHTMQHNNMFGQSASFHQIVSSIDFNQIGFAILFQHMCNVDWLWIILSNVKFNPIRKNRIENLAQNRIDLMKADFFFLFEGTLSELRELSGCRTIQYLYK